MKALWRITAALLIGTFIGCGGHGESSSEDTVVGHTAEGLTITVKDCRTLELAGANHSMEPYGYPESDYSWARLNMICTYAGGQYGDTVYEDATSDD